MTSRVAFWPWPVNSWHCWVPPAGRHTLFQRTSHSKCLGSAGAFEKKDFCLSRSSCLFISCIFIVTIQACACFIHDIACQEQNNAAALLKEDSDASVWEQLWKNRLRTPCSGFQSWNLKKYTTQQLCQLLRYLHYQLPKRWSVPVHIHLLDWQTDIIGWALRWIQQLVIV